MNNEFKSRKEAFQASATCVHCTEPKEEGSFCCAKHRTKALPWKLTTSFYTLRSQVMDSDEKVKDDPSKSWQLETPYDTRQLAIQEAATALKAAITNKKRGNISQFNLGYKSRKDPKQVFCVDSSAIKLVKKRPKKPTTAKKSKKGKKGKKAKKQPTSENTWLQIFPTRLGDQKYVRIRKRAMKQLPDVFQHDCKIMKFGKEYYLLYIYEKQTQDKMETKDNMIALDPGVRTFQTGYSPSGVLVKCGEHQRTLIHRLHEKLDTLRSLRTKAHQKRKQRIRNACLRMEHKIINTIDNLHNQTANYISKNYGVVLLPKFSTSVMQKGTTLASTTKRDLWTFSHYKFQQKLIGLCNFHNTTLYIVEEDFTTKTCGVCGELKEVGKAKIFECTSCGYKQDRDIHGARNIMLKHITQHGVV